MLNWQQRVVNESDELAYKLDRLKDFIVGGEPTFSTLDPEDQTLLRQQYDYMLGYFTTLNARIAKFKMTVVSHAD